MLQKLSHKTVASAPQPLIEIKDTSPRRKSCKLVQLFASAFVKQMMTSSLTLFTDDSTQLPNSKYFSFEADEGCKAPANVLNPLAVM